MSDHSESLVRSDNSRYSDLYGSSDMSETSEKVSSG